MGYESCEMEPGMCLKYCGEHYEHIAVCVDDLLISSKDPQGAADDLTNKHHFKLMGTGPISYHLGCDFERDEDGTLYFLPRKCIEKLEECYFNMFGSNPKITIMLPLEKGDHLELNTSKCLD